MIIYYLGNYICGRNSQGRPWVSSMFTTVYINRLSNRQLCEQALEMIRIGH